MGSLRLALSAAFLVSVILGAPPQRADAAACNSGGTPTTTVYLPNITKTFGGPTGWVTPFIVQNVGHVSTTLEVSFYRFTDGALVACRKIEQVGVGNSFADVPNADADLPDNSQFSVVVRSYGSEIVAVVNEHAGSGARSEALSYVGLSSGAPRLALPYVAKHVDGWLTTIVVQNLGASPTTVTASFVSFDGRGTATLTRSIGPGRSAVIDPTVESSLQAGTEYSVLLSASEPLGAIVNAHNDAATAPRPMGFSYNGVATIPFTRVARDRDRYVPYVARNADGIGRTSRILVQNAGTDTARPSLSFRPMGGGAPLTINAPRDLAPGHSWSFDPGRTADGLAPCPSGAAGCLRDGEHSLVVSGGGFAVVSALLTPSTAMAFTGAAPSPSRIFLPNVTRTLGGSAGWTTPIIVQSAGATSASLRWFRFEDGRLVTRQSLTGLSDGVSVRVDPRTVSGLSDNTQYAVVLDAPGRVNAIVTELAPGAGGDGTMIYEGFASLVEPQPVPTIITVSPGPVTLGPGMMQTFSASVIDQFGGASTWPVTWSVSPPEIGYVSPGGQFVATGSGSGKIVASSGATSGSATVTVNGLAPVAAVTTALGYSDLTVPTSRGSFRVHVIKERLSDVEIKTITGNAADCEADCVARPLADYVRDTGAYAGMNGTYLCPPDYAQCAGKVNTYEYSVYSSYLGKWLNRYALVSPTNALMTVSGGTPRFYRRVTAYDRSDVTAAISNFPILLLGGQVVDTEAEQQDYQKLRGVKGSIGTDGTHVFLALVRSASVTESAYVLQALGVRDAMNLDGGGTSAMYIGGSYKVGPGRLLPNSVLLVRR